MKLNNETSTRVEQLLYFYMEYYGNYHSQKETITWTGLAIYLSLVGAVVGFAHGTTFQIQDAVIFSLFTFTIGYFVKKFLLTQLEAKAVAADVVDACHNLLLKLLSGDLGTFDFRNDIGDINQHPATVAEEINNLRILKKRMPITSNLSTVIKRSFYANLRQEKVENFIFTVFWVCNLISTLIWWKEIIQGAIKSM